jgi:DNA-directed RNA polymerase subunit RPC12/RpoP
MTYHYYCKRCGRIYISDANSENCDYCGSESYPVPEKYWDEGEFFMRDEQEELLREELVKTSPVFDEYLFNHRDEDMRAEWAKSQAALARGRAILEGRDKGNRFGVECPYCHATNVRKVSLAGRAVSAGIFGLGSKKIGKQWHCNKCGSDF